MPSTLQAQDTPATIAIIGGGFSGSLVATHLLKTATRPLTVTLIERSSAWDVHRHRIAQTVADTVVPESQSIIANQPMR